MALSRTQVDQNEITTSTTSNWTSTSFAADENDLIVIVVQRQHYDTGAYGNPEYSVSSSGVSFTTQVAVENNTTGSYPQVVEIFTGLVPSTGSRTVTVNSNGLDHWGWVTVFKYSGVNTVNPVRQAKENNLAVATQSNGSYTYNLDLAPLSTSEVLAGLVVDSAYSSLVYQTPGTGWSELLDDTYSDGTQYGSAHIMCRGGSTSTSITYDDLNTTDASSLSYEWAMGALEIAASINSLDFPSSPSEGDRYAQNGMVFYYSRGAWRKLIPSKMAMLSYGLDNDGTALNTGIQGSVHIPYGLDIIRWTLIGDQSGSANIDLWSSEYGTVPTVANSVTGNIGMTISTATANQSGDIDNWRMTRINAGNVVTFNVQSVSTITRLTINLFGEEL